MLRYRKKIDPLGYFQEAKAFVRVVSLIISTVLVTFVFTTPAFAKGVEVVKRKNSAYEAASALRMQKSVDRAVDLLSWWQRGYFYILAVSAVVFIGFLSLL